MKDCELRTFELDKLNEPDTADIQWYPKGSTAYRSPRIVGSLRELPG